MATSAKSGPLSEAHRAATERANAWRGRCVNQFARGELIVGEALLAQSAIKTLPMLLSQRIARLSSLVKDAPKKVDALEAFSGLSDLRNAIVHGSGTIFIDGEGNWLITLRAAGRSGLDQASISQDQADERLVEVRQTVDRLCSALKT